MLIISLKALKMDHSFIVNNCQLFGEIAIDKNRNYAFLEGLNFGHKNFLNICDALPGALDYAGDTRGSKCLLALLQYTSETGNTFLNSIHI